MEENRKPLDIPTNASDKDDYIQGIGRKELAIIAVSLIGCVIIAVITYSILNDMMKAACLAFIVLTVTVMIVKRDIYNETMIDKIRIMVNYIKMQKQYKYIQQDFLEVSNEQRED